MTLRVMHNFSDLIRITGHLSLCVCVSVCLDRNRTPNLVVQFSCFMQSPFLLLFLVLCLQCSGQPANYKSVHYYSNVYLHIFPVNMTCWPFSSKTLLYLTLGRQYFQTRWKQIYKYFVLIYIEMPYN